MESLINNLSSENKLNRTRAVESLKNPTSETFHAIHDTFYGRTFSIQSTPWTEFDGILTALTKLYSEHSGELTHREGEIDALRPKLMELLDFSEVRVRESAGKCHAAVCAFDKTVYRVVS